MDWNNRLVRLVRDYAKESGRPWEYLEDLAQHGCASCVEGALVYTVDCVRVYEAHEDEILAWLEEWGYRDAPGLEEISSIANRRVWAAVDTVAGAIVAEGEDEFWEGSGLAD